MIILDKPLLTVIIPVYNTSEYIDRCIESVINQTEQNIDIIIINDASTDNSNAIIQNYAAAYPRINYINLPSNIGVGNARNIGISNAKTKYIAFIDSDDWVDTTYYENMLECMVINHSDICISGIKTEVDDVYAWKYRYQYPSNFTVDGYFCIHALTKQYNSDISISPIVNNKIYNKELILTNKIEFDKSRRAQDLFFSFMTFVYASRVSICCDCFYHYYQRNFSATHNFSEQYVDDYFYILYTLKSELKERKLYSKYQKEYIKYVNHYMTKLINNMFNNVQKEDEQRYYFIYILKKASTIISIETIMEYIDITKLKDFWILR